MIFPQIRSIRRAETGNRPRRIPHEMPFGPTSFGTVVGQFPCPSAPQPRIPRKHPALEESLLHLAMALPPAALL